MDFKYQYEHLRCECCTDLTGRTRCPHYHCPYILDNLEDLKHDPAFRCAVRRADRCNTHHRPALMLVQRWGLQWAA